MLHKLKIDKGIFLDEVRLRGVVAYKINQVEGEDVAHLTLEMDVSILGNATGADLDGFLNQSGDGIDRNG